MFFVKLKQERYAFREHQSMDVSYDYNKFDPGLTRLNFTLNLMREENSAVGRLTSLVFLICNEPLRLLLMFT
jgi:hypothetical protein